MNIKKKQGIKIGIVGIGGKMGQSIAQSIADSAFGGVGKLAGRLAKRGYGKARK